jgi:hypothetical protein
MGITLDKTELMTTTFILLITAKIAYGWYSRARAEFEKL